MILGPGARSLRAERRSRLAFYWEAREASLLPITGQGVQLLNGGASSLVGGTVTPKVGSAVTAGNAMPRFGYNATLGENYLALSGTTGGQDVEQLNYFAVLPARDQTALLRFTGLWTAGASVTGGLFQLGLDPAIAAGSILLWRSGTNYVIARQDAAHGQVSSLLAENAALVWPADALISYVGATGIVSLSVRSANGTIYGPVTSGSSSYIAPNKRWGGQGLAIGRTTANAGAPINLYRVKIALAVKTFAQMDALT
jgi:hypothetical protein